MTREIIKQIERDYWAEKADPIDMAEIFDLAQKALEQESVIDKIRAEIDELDYITFDGITKRRCLEIIDKYKAKKEE